MKRFRIGKKTAKWLFEFVSRRKFYVQIGQFQSRIYESTSGVPAGSVLGPSLFLIHIDDIDKCVRFAMMLLFADDVKMMMRISSMDETRCFQMDIDSLLQWSKENRLPFNPKKCSILTIRRTREFHNATYMLEEHEIERKNENRDLGILMNEKGTFASHIEQVTNKARQSMGYIKWISRGQFGTRALKVLYTSYVRSKLEFGSVIWDPYNDVYRSDIESIQKQFVMYVLGDSNRIPPYRLAPYEERCRKLGLETLSNRREVTNVLMAYDLYNGRINDVNIDKRIIRQSPKYDFKKKRLVSERVYKSDYEYNQPMAKVIRNVNEYSDIMMLSRNKFKTELRKKLFDQNDLVPELFF